MDVAVIVCDWGSVLVFFVGDSAMLFDAVLSLRRFAMLLQREQWLDGWTAAELSLYGFNVDLCL